MGRKARNAGKKASKTETEPIRRIPMCDIPFCEEMRLIWCTVCNKSLCIECMLKQMKSDVTDESNPLAVIKCPFCRKWSEIPRMNIHEALAVRAKKEEQTKTEDSEEEDEETKNLIRWAKEQYIAIQSDDLDEERKNLFLDLVAKNPQNSLLLQAFKEASKTLQTIYVEPMCNCGDEDCNNNKFTAYWLEPCKNGCSGCRDSKLRFEWYRPQLMHHKDEQEGFTDISPS